jgi:uncharacterized membrane protein
VVILVALAAVISIVFPLLSGQTPNWSTLVSSWVWVPEVLIIIAVIGVIVWMSQTLRGDLDTSHQGFHSRHYYRRHGMEGPASADSAIEIARKRFARGEITQDQFSQILRQLGGKPGSDLP